MFRLKNGVDHRIRSDSGAVGIVFALVLIPLVLMIGLAIDFGRAYNTRSRLQECADAAALAGARHYASSKQLPEAKAIAADLLQRGFYPDGYKLDHHFQWSVLGQATPKGNVLTVSAHLKVDTYFVRIIPKYRHLDIKVTSRAMAAEESFDEGKLTVTVDQAFNNSQYATGVLTMVLLPKGATSTTPPKESAEIMKLGPLELSMQGSMKKVFENAKDDDVVAFRIPKLVRANKGQLIMNSFCRLPDYMYGRAAINPHNCPQETALDLSQPKPQQASYKSVPLIQNTEVWMKKTDTTHDSLSHFPAEYEYTWGRMLYTTKYGYQSQSWSFPELPEEDRFLTCPKVQEGVKFEKTYRIYYLYFGDVDPIGGASTFHKITPETVSAAFRVTCTFGRKGTGKEDVPHLVQ